LDLLLGWLNRRNVISVGRFIVERRTEWRVIINVRRKIRGDSFKCRNVLKAIESRDSDPVRGGNE